MFVLQDYDSTWPRKYESHRNHIAVALGPLAQSIEHIGSTSVPGLAAKPIVDILVIVPNIDAEAEFLPALAAAGYELHVREAGHFMARTTTRDIHVHILGHGDPAATAYIAFRDHLRRDERDRALHERTKRSLIGRDWADMDEYAEAKSPVISDIMARA